MTDLVLRPSGLPESSGKPWSLQLRDHGMAEVDYRTIAHVGDETAREIVAAGTPFWLFGEPDWTAREARRAAGRAAALRAEADAIERDVRTP